MAALKVIISLYRDGEEKPIKDIRPGLKSRRRINLFRRFKTKYFRVSGLNEQAQKFGLGSFDLKLYRLAKVNGKAEN